MEKKVVKVNRPENTIKSNIIPLDTALKQKIAIAFQEIVNKIKAKHLS